MAFVYVLYSGKLDRFYIGSCLNLNERLEGHKNKSFDNSFTTRASDWQLYLQIDDLEYGQARRIEQHIKKMKSKKYVQNLKTFPEMIGKLVKRYSLDNIRDDSIDQESLK